MRFAVLGDPVARSKSPAMHRAAYEALGVADVHSYEAIRVPKGDLVPYVAALRGGEYDGFNLTVPHKVDVFSLLEPRELDPSAREIGAVNTLVRRADGTLRAHNTDGPALRDELATLAGQLDLATLVNRSAIVLGNGGAARSAYWALRALGVRDIEVRGRTPGPPNGTSPFAVAPLAPSAVESTARFVVQATSAGMIGAAPGDVVVGAIDWARLPDEAVAYDVVYGTETPFLVAARARGLAAADGLGMLAGQGALALEAWLGVEAPRAAMRAALIAAAAASSARELR